MELPYSGRAVIEDNFGTVTVTIRPPKRWPMTIFICFWLCGWLVGLVAAFNMLLNAAHPFLDLFILAWLTFWCIAGIKAIGMVVWHIAGREIITAGQGILQIERKNALFQSPRTYDLTSVQNMRVFDERNDGYFFSRRRNTNLFRTDQGGVIRFDYGLKAIKFAAGIDEAEAFHIINLLKEKGILTQHNILSS